MNSQDYARVLLFKYKKSDYLAVGQRYDISNDKKLVYTCTNFHWLHFECKINNLIFQ